MARIAQTDEYLRIPFMQRKTLEEREIPVFEMPELNMDPDAAQRIVKDELYLDGNPTLNLASFVNTRMDKQCDDLMAENLSKNFIDSAEYPQCSVIESKCGFSEQISEYKIKSKVAILRHLFHAPEASIREERSVYRPSSPPMKIHGKSTVGSSEAIMLSAMNLKWMWQREQPLVNGKPTPPCITSDFIDCGKIKPGKENVTPNLVFSETAHVCWHKFCRYFSVEQHRVPITKQRRVLDVDKAIALCDQNTIGVVAILGNTYTGEFDDVKELNDKLEILNKKTGWNIPIHVDAASGGLIATFMFPELEWDFRLKWVKSINISGHKYGMVYPGIGWFLIRDFEFLHKGIIFEVDYLGERELTLTLNFSKGASHVLAQYYQFLRLGKAGAIFKECLLNARFIEKSLKDWEGKSGSKIFEVFSNVSSEKPALPVIAFTSVKKNLQVEIEIFIQKLRVRGWIIPLCHLPIPDEDVSIARIVIREAHTEDLANLLIWDVHKAIQHSQKMMGVVCTEQHINSDEESENDDIPAPFRRIQSIC